MNSNFGRNFRGLTTGRNFVEKMGLLLFLFWGFSQNSCFLANEFPAMLTTLLLLAFFALGTVCARGWFTKQRRLSSVGIAVPRDDSAAEILF
jgi:hypothetical protein